jgi:hypothetical protein
MNNELKNLEETLASLSWGGHGVVEDGRKSWTNTIAGTTWELLYRPEEPLTTLLLCSWIGERRVGSPTTLEKVVAMGEWDFAGVYN